LKSSSTISPPHIPPKNTPTILCTICLVSEGEVSEIISQSSNFFFDLDLIPTFLLKQCISALLPTLTNIINLSLASDTFQDQFESCSVIPPLMKYNHDKEDLSNYIPIAHFSILSKLNERVVKNRLTSHLSTNNLLNSYQSAYTRHQSTESTLLAVHDHIIKSVSEHKVTALCVLDLSAAFDIMIMLLSFIASPLGLVLMANQFAIKWF